MPGEIAYRYLLKRLTWQSKLQQQDWIWLKVAPGLFKGVTTEGLIACRLFFLERLYSSSLVGGGGGLGWATEDTFMNGTRIDCIHTDSFALGDPLPSPFVILMITNSINIQQAISHECIFVFSCKGSGLNPSLNWLIRILTDQEDGPKGLGDIIIMACFIAVKFKFLLLLLIVLAAALARTPNTPIPQRCRCSQQPQP